MRVRERPVERGRAAAAVIVAAVLLAGGRAPPAPAAAPTAPRLPVVERHAGDLARAIAEDAPLPVAYVEATPEPAGSLAGSLAGSPAVPPAAAARLVEGPMEAVLYGPATGPVAAEAARLLAHKLDLTRDLALGDRVRLLVRRNAAGTTVLDYAELDGAAGRVRLYRRGGGDGLAAADFADVEGAPLDRQLLRTPLDSRRITSGFGLRRHPLLGYTRLHRGVDFAAAVGTPVLAAGDGVVEQAGWAGGYGRSVRLRHAGGIETLYAHLSAWAPGLAPGRPVRQGQLIARTGASGLATGPHLHFEVIVAGEPVDPAGVRPTPAPLSLGERLAFQARKAEIDARLARGG